MAGHGRLYLEVSHAVVEPYCLRWLCLLLFLFIGCNWNLNWMFFLDNDRSEVRWKAHLSLISPHVVFLDLSSYCKSCFGFCAVVALVCSASGIVCCLQAEALVSTFGFLDCVSLTWNLFLCFNVSLCLVFGWFEEASEFWSFFVLTVNLIYMVEVGESNSLYRFFPIYRTIWDKSKFCEYCAKRKLSRAHYRSQISSHLSTPIK
jgi:hypothetical protein